MPRREDVDPLFDGHPERTLLELSASQRLRWISSAMRLLRAARPAGRMSYADRDALAYVIGEWSDNLIQATGARERILAILVPQASAGLAEAIATLPAALVSQLVEASAGDAHPDVLRVVAALRDQGAMASMRVASPVRALLGCRMDFDEALSVLAALETERVDYVLVGSMAMAAQGLIRATRDLDLFVAPAAANVERLRSALKRVFGDDPNLDLLSADDLAGDYPAIEYTPPHGLYSLDILSRLGDAFRFEDLEAEEIVIDGVRINVATPRTLYRMKRDTVRPLDRIDAEAIRVRFGLTEE